MKNDLCISIQQPDIPTQPEIPTSVAHAHSLQRCQSQSPLVTRPIARSLAPLPSDVPIIATPYRRHVCCFPTPPRSLLQAANKEQAHIQHCHPAVLLTYRLPHTEHRWVHTPQHAAPPLTSKPQTIFTGNIIYLQCFTVSLPPNTHDL